MFFHWRSLNYRLLSLWCFIADEPAGTSEEELSCGEVEASEIPESLGTHPSDQNLKGVLLSKYSGHLSNLRKEFLKQRKKGKLPKDAKTLLLDWWNDHYRWPYPTVIIPTVWLSCLFFSLHCFVILSNVFFKSLLHVFIVLVHRFMICRSKPESTKGESRWINLLSFEFNYTCLDHYHQSIPFNKFH